MWDQVRISFSSIFFFMSPHNDLFPTRIPQLVPPFHWSSFKHAHLDKDRQGPTSQ
jgi:hypothetical protein